MATIRDRYILEVDTQGGVRNIGAARSATAGLGGALRGIGPLATAAAGALAAIGAGQFISSVAEVTARTQDLRTALETVTGSSENATAAFDFINDFATETPFNIEELTNTFIKLQSAGIEPTRELLTTFGDAASVSTDRVGSLQAMADLFSRSVSGGLGLEDLNRLADRGINVFGILEEQLGLTRLEVSEFGQTAEGAQQIRDALVAGFNEEFGGGMARAADNMSVAFSNMGIAADNALLAVGEGGLGDGLQYAAEAITELLGSNSELAESLGSVLGDAIITVTDALVSLIEFFQEGGAQFEFLGTAASSVVEVFGALWDASMQITEALQPLTDIIFPALGSAIEFITTVIVTLVEGFANMVSGISDAITSAESFRDGVTGAFTAIYDAVVGTVGRLVTAVTDLFQGLYDALWGNSIIRDLIEGIIEGFTSLDVDLLGIVRSMIDGIISTFGELFGAIVDGIGGAIDAGLDRLRTAFDGFVSWFRGDSDEVEQAANDTRAALESAFDADTLTGDQIAGSADALNSLRENLVNIVEPMNTHVTALESVRESTESIRENYEEMVDILDDYRDELGDLVDLQEDQLDTTDELVDLYEDYIDYLNQDVELLANKNELMATLNELVGTHVEQMSQLNELLSENVNSNENKATVLETISQIYQSVIESVAAYIEGLRAMAENTASAVSETERLAQALEAMESRANSAAQAARQAIDAASQASQAQLPTGGTTAEIPDFAGFFARGGFIPAGQFGIAGEAGPEVVRGPATVDPLNGGLGQTNINYYISAVDAQSFRALVARDPEFIHQVAQRGSRGIPTRR